MFGAGTDQPPPGSCPQCWRHAYDKTIHQSLAPRQDCKPCLDHAYNRCPDKR